MFASVTAQPQKQLAEATATSTADIANKRGKGKGKGKGGKRNRNKNKTAADENDQNESIQKKDEQALEEEGKSTVNQNIIQNRTENISEENNTNFEEKNQSTSVLTSDIINNANEQKTKAGSDFEPFDSDDSSLSTGATPTLGPRIIEATLVPDNFITATDIGVLDDWTTLRGGNYNSEKVPRATM